MVARFPGCDPLRLEQLIDGELSPLVHDQLAAHLETCDRCRGRLELLAGAPKWWQDAKEYLTPVPAETAAAAECEAPRRARQRLPMLGPADDPDLLGRLGPYDVSEVIGRGGAGIVLKAFDPALNRQVAIKVLAPELATSGAARRRFLREAQAAAAVVHENVVPIHAIDQADELPYLVMAYIPGRSLQERLDATGPLSLAETLRIGRQVAAGLAAAHRQGLVHRDIKPANILLDQGVDRVQITDFGLARAVDDASLTQSGVVAGTPQYMAPEQARGEAIDHRADLFSLGSVLYAMCTGHPPFRAETTLAVLRRVCEEPVRPVRQVNLEVPEWLERLISRLHAKDPKERIQSAAEASGLLEQCLAHVQQPLAVALPDELARTKRRWPVGLAAVAAAAALLVGTLLATGAWRTKTDAQGPSAERSSQPAPASAARASGLSEWGRFDEELTAAHREAAIIESRLHPPPVVGRSARWPEIEALSRQLDWIERAADWPPQPAVGR